ncbi:MAG: hypothetical protein ACRDLB_11780 [Actinomycetota bacterium]
MACFRLVPFVGALLLTVACSGDVQRFEAQEVPGPPTVQIEVVEQHAEQFETDVHERPAGSEEEQIAAAYILGVLQQNGYFGRLDSVPVENLFRSTNVIAEPEGGGDDPAAIVVVPYGTGEDSPPNSAAIGLFLELARALNVAAPGHSVQFATVGAEYADVGSGALGSRRLARFLLDEERDPLVVQLVDISSDAERPFKAYGDAADEVNQIMLDVTGDEGITQEALDVDPDVFEEAGFRRMLVIGRPDVAGPVLLRFLEEVGD